MRLFANCFMSASFAMLNIMLIISISRAFMLTFLISLDGRHDEMRVMLFCGGAAFRFLASLNSMLQDVVKVLADA